MQVVRYVDTSFPLNEALSKLLKYEMISSRKINLFFSLYFIDFLQD